MNFANDEMDYGYHFPHQNDFQDMDYGSHDGYNSNFMGRGRWQPGGPIRRGRGGFNNYESRGPPQNHGNWNDDPQFTWGRGFGPNGPPIQRKNEDCPPIRYLMRCGVPRENLKNLPRSFLQLIDPAYCGVCNINLESFPMSRSHYSSRNHYKKQQKWLFEAPAEMGFRQSKNETPMKSRDLYCELCDVQITSKAHADSHYSGKAHRADQLIRRERKFLKPLDKVEKEEEKPSQPELYCEICKTSVTCTEQMTMHLNGKRHLSKEKQHILKMMKSDVPADGEEAEEGTEEGTEDGTSKGNPESQTGEGADKYDWGNGSGAWEETEEKPAAN